MRDTRAALSSGLCRSRPSMLWERRGGCTSLQAGKPRQNDTCWKAFITETALGVMLSLYLKNLSLFYYLGQNTATCQQIWVCGIHEMDGLVERWAHSPSDLQFVSELPWGVVSSGRGALCLFRERGRRKGTRYTFEGDSSQANDCRAL